MEAVGIFLILGLAALLVAWRGNAVVSILRGEHTRDTDRVWWELMAGSISEGIAVFIRGLTTRRSSWLIPALIVAGIVGLSVLIFKIMF